MDKSFQNNNIMLENQIIIARRTTPSRFFLYESSQDMRWVFSNMVVIYLVRGMVKIKTKLGEKVLAEKDIYLLNSNLFFHLEHLEANQILFLQIDTEYFKDPSQYYFDNNWDPKIKIDFVYKLGLLYKESLKDSPSLSHNYHLLDEIVNKIKGESKKKSFKSNQPASLETKDMVIEIIEESSIDNKYDFNLGKLALTYNISAPHLSRTFKKVLGENITSFFRKKRLNYAIDMLINSQLTITQISSESGFSSIGSLNKELNREFGMSAGYFRNHYRELQASYLLKLKYKDDLNKFIDHIQSRSENQEVLDQTKDNLKNIALKGPSLRDNLGWNNFLDLESIINEDIYELVDLFKYKLKFEAVRISFTFRLKEFGYLGKNGEFKALSLENMEDIIDIFINYRILPLFSLQVSNQALEKDQLIFLNKLVDIFYRKRAYLRTKVWFIELNYGSAPSFLIANQQLISYRLKELRTKFNKDFFKNFKLGINLGSFEIYDHKNNLALASSLNWLENKLDFISFQSTCINFNFISSNDYAKKLNSLREHLEGILWKDEEKSLIFVDLAYDLSTSQNSILYQAPYFYILYIGLIAKIISKNTFLISTKINHKYLDDKNQYTDYLNIFHQFNIYNFNFFIKDFINRLGSEIIYDQDGILITRDGKDYLGLVFGSIYEYVPHMEDEVLLENLKNSKSIQLSLSPIEGNYRKSISKLSNKNYYFYENWIKSHPYKLSKDEKTFITARSLPDLDLEYLYLDGRLDLNFNLKNYELYFLKLEYLDNFKLY